MSMTDYDDTVYPKKYAHGFCFAVLCCGYTLTDFPISIRLTSLALWQSNDCPSASKQPWWIWINTSCEFIMNDCITTTKQSTTKPCAYFWGYTVRTLKYIWVIWGCEVIRNHDDYIPCVHVPLTLLMPLKQEYSRLTRSIPWVLLPWHLTPPGHQQQCYESYRINRSLPPTNLNFNNLYNLCVEIWQQILTYIQISSNTFSVRSVKWTSMQRNHQLDSFAWQRVRLYVFFVVYLNPLCVEIILKTQKYVSYCISILPKSFCITHKTMFIIFYIENDRIQGISSHGTDHDALIEYFGYRRDPFC